MTLRRGSACCAGWAAKLWSFADTVRNWVTRLRWMPAIGPDERRRTPSGSSISSWRIVSFAARCDLHDSRFGISGVCSKQQVASSTYYAAKATRAGEVGQGSGADRHDHCRARRELKGPWRVQDVYPTAWFTGRTLPGRAAEACC